ncbi:MAG TPA: DoxX family protein [Nitriliruptorales bacterium]|jgi:putative oxidoreductase
MTTQLDSIPGRSLLDRVRVTEPHAHVIVLRLIGGAPLLLLGLAHVFVSEAPMEPLVDAAGLPFPSIVAPIGVAIEIVAGLSLLLGAWARVGGLLAIPVMLGAVWTHLVVDVWPNGVDNEPPLALPIVVAIAAAYVVARGPGRWSVDRRRHHASSG